MKDSYINEKIEYIIVITINKKKYLWFVNY